MSRIFFNKQTGEMEVAPDPRVGRNRPTIPRIPTIPKRFPNIPNMPNLQGIGGIPGLQNIDFSNLPMGMNFGNFDPRAINANSQGFQDMIERARAQEGLQGSLGGPMEFGEARKRAIMTGTRMPNPADYDMSPLGPRSSDIPTDIPLPEGGRVGTMGGPGYGEFPLGTAGPRVDPSDPNYIPPPSSPGFGDFTTLPVRNPDGTTMGSILPPQAPVQTTAPVQPNAPVPAPVQPTAPVQQPLAPYTGSNEPAPYASNVVRTETGMDALTKQLLFGLDGKGGFIPGAMRAAEKTFFNADGTPRVVEEQVAGLSPDQIRAQELAREGIGIQDPYLQQAGEAYATGVGALDRGLTAARSRAEQGLGATQRGVSQEEALRNQGLNRILGGVDQFGQRSGSLGRQAMDSTAAFGGRLGESEGLIRGTTGAYDPSLTSQFYNPYEDRVVQQTIDDVFEAGEKQDMAARARDIQTGGESAFGSRARLGAAERRESLGRGLGEALGALRSRGFSEAQQTGMGEFARQRDAERAAASGLSGLAGSRLASQQALGSNLQGLSGQQLAAQQTAGSALGGAGQSALAGQQQLAGAFSGLSNLESQIGQQQQQAQFGLGSNLQGLGQQAQTANQAGVGQLYNIGQQQQNLQQQQLDAQRRNQLQAQQAPLAQYQALSPFIQMAPQGQFQAQTTFAPPPSPMQAALTTGLGAFGAIGNFMNPGTGR